MIVFTKHAKEKLLVLKRHGFFVTEAEVLKTLQRPEATDYSRAPLLIAQRRIDRLHVLRVVYKKKDDAIVVITFYPGRITQYERKRQN